MNIIGTWIPSFFILTILRFRSIWCAALLFSALLGPQQSQATRVTIDYRFYTLADSTRSLGLTIPNNSFGIGFNVDSTIGETFGRLIYDVGSNEGEFSYNIRFNGGTYSVFHDGAFRLIAGDPTLAANPAMQGLPTPPIKVFAADGSFDDPYVDGGQFFANTGYWGAWDLAFLGVPIPTSLGLDGYFNGIGVPTLRSYVNSSGNTVLDGWMAFNLGFKGDLHVGLAISGVTVADLPNEGPIPEPATILLLGSTLFGGLLNRRTG